MFILQCRRVKVTGDFSRYKSTPCVFILMKSSPALEKTLSDRNLHKINCIKSALTLWSIMKSTKWYCFFGANLHIIRQINNRAPHTHFLFYQIKLSFKWFFLKEQNLCSIKIYTVKCQNTCSGANVYNLTVTPRKLPWQLWMLWLAVKDSDGWELHPVTGKARQKNIPPKTADNKRDGLDTPLLPLSGGWGDGE